MLTRVIFRLLPLLGLLFAGSVARAAPPDLPGGRRPLQLEVDGRWIGNGVCFSPYRDGQSPHGASPSEDEILADLRLISPYWQLLRTYELSPMVERTIALIRHEHLPVRLLLGAWILPETNETNREANRAQCNLAIRLANAYPDIVLAVIVGNETCVDWSDHVVGPAALIPWIRAVRGAVRQPVTTADDYNFWNKAAAQAVAAEVDFITLHAYALWNGRPLAEAMGWTGGVYDSIVRLHPGVPVIFGETGWATRHDATATGPGREGTLMKAEVSVAAQESYLRQHYDWVARTRVPVILFEAFDENWKGGGDQTSPDTAEKHWGVFGADRKPKASFAAIIRDYYRR